MKVELWNQATGWFERVWVLGEVDLVVDVTGGAFLLQPLEFCCAHVQIDCGKGGFRFRPILGCGRGRKEPRDAGGALENVEKT